MVVTPLSSDMKDILNELDTSTFNGEVNYCKEGSYWWIAYDNKTPAGFAGLTYYKVSQCAFLCRCGVLSQYRGLGLQKRFIRARERQVAKGEYRRIITYVAPYNIHSANNLIICGYKLYVPPYYWGVNNALYFEKIITV